MARYRKSYEQQLNVLNEQITKAQEKLDSLLAQRETVLLKKREVELSELYNVLQENGRTVEEVLAMINEVKQQDSKK